MATKFFLRASVSAINNSELVNPADERDALLTAGASLATASTGTQLGPVGCDGTLFPVAVSQRLVWFSNPLDAVTISGTITVNLWMSENNMSANAGPEIAIARMDNAGLWVANILGCVPVHNASAGSTFEKGTELPVTTRAAQNWTATPASTTLSSGDRLAFVVKGNDGGGTMAATFTFDLGFDGATGGADGDSFVSFTETITESVPKGAYLSPYRQILAQATTYEPERTTFLDALRRPCLRRSLA